MEEGFSTLQTIIGGGGEVTTPSGQEEEGFSLILVNIRFVSMLEFVNVAIGFVAVLGFVLVAIGFVAMFEFVCF